MQDKKIPKKKKKCEHPESFVNTVEHLYKKMLSESNRNELSNQTDSYYQGNREGWKQDFNFYSEFRDVAEFSRHVISFFDDE